MNDNKLDKNKILEFFGQSVDKLNVLTPEVVTSTNDIAKEEWLNHPKHWTLVATNKQTAGRGRLGKKFYSSLDHGLYFSLVFNPNEASLENVPLYTIMAAATLIEVLEEYVEEPIRVKWVNDIFYKGRKVSGILSELVFPNYNQDHTGIIVGIGLNFSGRFTQANKDTQNVAGNLFGEETPSDFDQNKFLYNFIQRFYNYHETFHEKEFMKVYEKHLLGIGKKVTYMEKSTPRSGTILGIDNNGHLKLRMADGKTETLYGQAISFNSAQFLGDE